MMECVDFGRHHRRPPPPPNQIERRASVIRQSIVFENDGRRFLERKIIRRRNTLGSSWLGHADT